MKGALATLEKLDVYRRADTDFTLGGVSSKYPRLYLLVAPGELPANVNPAQVVVLTETAPGYKVLVPLYASKPDHAGPMNGGNYAGSNGKMYPVHDRYETWEQYNQLST